MLAPDLGSVPGPASDALALVPGLTGGLLAIGATALVYFAEDLFARLPVHWMWWPALGGLIIGIGGLIEPRALGVGYDVIDQLLTGHATQALIVGILVVKTAIWSLSLGSGTSGGVLAPVFMIGASLGAAESGFLPHCTPGFWATLGLAAVVGGVMRSPLTGTSVSAYALSVLLLKRSVLTEKIARRRLHLTREYTTDPLESFFAHEVMTPEPRADFATPARVFVHPDETLREVANKLAENYVTSAPVVDRDDPTSHLGVITLAQLLHARRRDLHEEHHRERLLP
ncbi:chloride channel protein [Kutzneria chonburiensis]|uniref:Chloride channel protein n=1 Tax=Kutzneria chonburiensis TaxID=1483604 RepID=A0ABV6MTQ7_9PSEU